LYCTPSDIYDLYGTEGGQLRVDDHNLATGQTVVVRATANAAATSIPVMGLRYPLLAGEVLEFDGGGMPAVVEVVLSATAKVGDTSLTVNPLSASVFAAAQAFGSGVNLALAQRLLKGCQYGTAKVQDYCLSRYNDSDLMANARLNGSVNRWATAIGARWVGRRRGQSAPEGVEAEAEEALSDLKEVRTGMMSVGGIATRTSGWPFLSNVTVDPRFDYAKLRVEQPLSELTPTQYGQYIDWNSVCWLEW
jgi:hypothetical protein